MLVHCPEWPHACEQERAGAAPSTCFRPWQGQRTACLRGFCCALCVSDGTGARGDPVSTWRPFALDTAASGAAPRTSLLRACSHAYPHHTHHTN